MDSLHLDTSPDSAQRLTDLFSTYGLNLELNYGSADPLQFLLSLLEEGLISVVQCPYAFDPDIASQDLETLTVYRSVSRVSRWRPGTHIEKVRLNVLHQFKLCGTPILSDGKYFLYQDYHLCAYAGNEDCLGLIQYLGLHPDIENWILFTNPRYGDPAYYIFRLTPQALHRMDEYYRTYSAKMWQSLARRQSSAQKAGPSPSGK